MDFLDVFNEESIMDNHGEIKKVNSTTRKRKLDEYIESFVDRSDDETDEKKTKLSNFILKNPLDNLKTETITTTNCVHEVVFRKDIPHESLKPRLKVPVQDFPFTLDAFQLQAVQCIENNQNVLVSAHTSAGKTVCASYAIAQCMKKKCRVIYTTPIKALSNQKYREFKKEYDDVGMLTGDVTINENASILIMTTEILRLMLYKNSSVIKEVGWVIYDEIHYMRDKNRGVVWEESIILLPSNVRAVFLSATIPNAREFAQWIVHIHGHPCNIIYTDYRPTPLLHYVYPTGADRIYQIVDEKGEFLESHFNQAISALKNIGDTKSDSSKLDQNANETQCETLITKMFELKKNPIIVFSFSKKACELYAKMLSQFDYTSRDEKDQIDEIFENARKTLPIPDRKLPQIDVILNLVKRGIGVHHGGLLPMLKEIVEILFGAGYIKCLFATETFSMGLNMPAKTVIYTSARKFDGTDMRMVTSGEYIQMSGRAGRRGLDSNGTVILMIDRTVKSEEVKRMVKGETEPLNSSFHLTYNMILNLMRAGEVNPEYLMERSFLQLQTYSRLPNLIEKYEELQKCTAEINLSEEDHRLLAVYHRTESDISSTKEAMWSVLRNEKMYESFICPGRLIHVKVEDNDFGWCIILSKIMTKFKTQRVLCLVPVSHQSLFAKELSMATPPAKDELKPDALVLNVQLKYLLEMSSVVIRNVKEELPNLERSSDTRKEYLSKRNNVVAKFNMVPLLDSAKEMKCQLNSVIEFEQKIKTLEEDLRSNSLHSDPLLKSKMDLYLKKIEIDANMTQIRSEIERKLSLIKMDELKSRKRILRRQQFLTESDVIELKGQVACEISTSDELMLTELMLSGDFSNMDPEALAGFLSCFVFEEFAREIIMPQADLAQKIEKMREFARHISRVSKECRLTVFPATDEDAYVGSFRIGLVELVRAWAMGARFGVLCANTEICEGSIIRCIRRLDELLGQLEDAAKVIGNVDLEQKFIAASKLIKRGIVFSSSLYLAN